MPTFADSRARHVDARRGQVLAEVAVVQGAPERGLPVVEVFARIRVHGLIVSTVQFLVADRICGQPASLSDAFGSWRAYGDDIVRRLFVDAGEQRLLVRVWPQPSEIDRQHTGHAEELNS